MVVFDVAVIGAGIAGLSCAQQLSQAGYTVVVVEKSRGLGGRIATRRLYGTCADHGLRYLEQQGPLLQQLVQILSERHMLQVWTDTVYEHLPDRQLISATQFPRYVAPDGMSAIAKFLATGLDIWLNQRVEAVVAPAGDDLWHICLDSKVEASTTPQKLTARAVVSAIPAPQALILLEPLAKTGLNSAFLDNLRTVEFDPCLSVIAGYSSDRLHQAPDWKAVTFIDDPDLTWIGLDSSKRMVAGQPEVFVVQSSAEFAKRYLEAQDLHPSGHQLLARAAQYLLSWLDHPDWMQVHRWRYAFPSHSWHETCLSASGIPLVCCGDWCGGASSRSFSGPSAKLSSNQVESAIVSGLAAATEINSQLQQRSLPGHNLFNIINYRP